MQHNLVRELRRISSVPLAPIVTHSISKDIAGTIKRSTGDSPANRRITLETMLSVLIPVMKSPITSGGTESAMNRVKRDGIDRVDIADIPVIRRRLAMALEAKVGARVLLLDVLDGTTTLNTTHREARRVGKAANHARLPFQRRLQGLVELGGVIEVDDVDIPIRRADDQ